MLFFLYCDNFIIKKILKNSEHTSTKRESEREVVSVTNKKQHKSFDVIEEEQKIIE